MAPTELREARYVSAVIGSTALTRAPGGPQPSPSPLRAPVRAAFFEPLGRRQLAPRRASLHPRTRTRTPMSAERAEGQVILFSASGFSAKRFHEPTGKSRHDISKRLLDPPTLITGLLESSRALRAYDLNDPFGARAQGREANAPVLCRRLREVSLEIAFIAHRDRRGHRPQRVSTQRGPWIASGQPTR